MSSHNRWAQPGELSLRHEPARQMAPAPWPGAHAPLPPGGALADPRVGLAWPQPRTPPMHPHLAMVPIHRWEAGTSAMLPQQKADYTHGHTRSPRQKTRAGSPAESLRLPRPAHPLDSPEPAHPAWSVVLQRWPPGGFARWTTWWGLGQPRPPAPRCAMRNPRAPACPPVAPRAVPSPRPVLPPPWSATG